MTGQDLEAGDPALAAATGRDGLGRICHGFHLLIMAYFVLGWAVPWVPALWFYLAFVPGVAVQWQFNKDACILNNLESWLRTGRWRDPGNREEGAWLATLCEEWTGWRPGLTMVNAFTYSVLALLWVMALIHKSNF
jgi:hypothetical protein